jgi:hypothetical protein
MFWHMVANKMLTLMTNILFNSILSDMETGYKLFRRDVIQSIPLRCQRFDFEPEVTASSSSATFASTMSPSLQPARVLRGRRSA